MTDRELINLAKEASKNAYVPYSRFPVGAALECRGGIVFTGCNIENVSYGLTVCAERVALFNALSQGARRFIALALSAEEPVTPCGACRQVLAEFCDASLPIALTDHQGSGVRLTHLGALFPEPFASETL